MTRSHHVNWQLVDIHAITLQDILETREQELVSALTEGCSADDRPDLEAALEEVQEILDSLKTAMTTHDMQT